MSLKPDLEIFDADKGLMYMAEDKELYIEILQLFLHDVDSNSQSLADCLETDNLADYRVLVHALKNNLRTLGASNAGEAAYDQELHCKSGDIDYVKEHHSSFLGSMTLASQYMQQYLQENS